MLNRKIGYNFLITNKLQRQNKEQIDEILI